MYAFIVAVCARGHVTLYADNVYVDNVNGVNPIRAIFAAVIYDLKKILAAIQCCWAC